MDSDEQSQEVSPDYVKGAGGPADEEQSILTVHLLPLGVDLQIRPGDTLMAAAQRQGYVWPSLCRGRALCTRCVIEVEQHDDSFSEIELLEDDALRYLEQKRQDGRKRRLACQAKPRAAMTVVKEGVRNVADLKPRPRIRYI